MTTDGALTAPAVIMDARNECGHDKDGRVRRTYFCSSVQIAV
jgi:hypothetical protein